MLKLNQDNVLNDSNDKNKLLLIGFNDSQGVNTTFRIYKKSFMFYIEKELRHLNIKYDIFDCFSLFFNKTYYIDSFLKHNVDKEGIRLLQIYGNIKALEKCLIDYRLPAFISNVRNVYRLVYKRASINENITSELIKATSPIVIYSSGVNDLMQIVGTDPLSVIKHYKMRHKSPNFYYSIDQANNEKIINDVIAKIEENLKNIYSYNSNSNIIILGAYIPCSLRKKHMRVFRELINRYNECLQLLCRK